MGKLEVGFFLWFAFKIHCDYFSSFFCQQTQKVKVKVQSTHFCTYLISCLGHSLIVKSIDTSFMLYCTEAANI